MRRKLALVAGVVLLISIAGFLGVEAGLQISSIKSDRERVKYSNRVLEKMGTLKIGDELPDHEFIYFNGDSVMLSSLVRLPSVVVFTEPECKACESQTIRIKASTKSLDDFGAFIFVTAGYPEHELASNKAGHTRFLFVMDKNADYASQLRITNSPFSVFVDKNRRIQSIQVGELTEDQILKAIEEYRAAQRT